MWSTVSSSKWQGKKLFAKENLLWTWSKLKAFPHVAFQAKKATLGGMQELQMMLHENNKRSLGFKMELRDLTKKFPLFKTIQITMSSSFLYTLFAWNFSKKCSTLCNSQSLNNLEKWGTHPPPLPFDYWVSNIHHLCILRNNWGK